MRATGFNHLSVGAKDLEEALRFYEPVPAQSASPPLISASAFFVNSCTEAVTLLLGRKRRQDALNVRRRAAPIP